MPHKGKTSVSQIDEQEIRRKRVNLSQAFRDQRKVLQDIHGEGDRQFFPMERIAESLEISKDMLQQKIYGKKPMTRDWLIAIAAAHGFGSGKTDDLLLQLGLPRLDAMVPQEDFIIGFLDENAGTPIALAEFDVALRREGLSPLNTGKQDPAKPSNNDMPYTVEREIVRTYLDEGDQYDSLCTAYDFRYTCVAIAFLSKEGQIVARLEASADGTCTVNTDESPFPRIFKALEDTGEYQAYFSGLMAHARQERRRIESQLFDTKNYRYRYSANLKHDKVHVFYEEFNYNSPERNEYYLMEYVDGALRLTVSKQSMFMREYLSSEKYRRIYGKKTEAPQIVYDSLEEIESRLSSNRIHGFNRDILKTRRSAFQRLSKKVLKTLDDIRNGACFIRNFDVIYGDNPGEVCRYFGLLNVFNCSVNEDNIVSVGRAEGELLGPDGTSISVTFDELKRAFTLGYTDASQICRVKIERGTIEDVF